MIELVLPWPPSMNHYWRHAVVGRGRAAYATIYIGEEGREYRKTVERIVRRTWSDDAINVPFDVWITRRHPDNRRRDFDNILKASLDSLTHAGVWVDDSLINDAHMLKGPNTTDGIGLIYVRVEVLPEVQPALPIEPKSRATADERALAF